jgi:hypothetical protein
LALNIRCTKLLQSIHLAIDETLKGLSREDVFHQRQDSDYDVSLSDNARLEEVPIWIYQTVMWVQSPPGRRSLRHLGTLGKAASLLMLRTGLIIEKMVKTEGITEIIKLLSFVWEFKGDIRTENNSVAEATNEAPTGNTK